MYRSTSIDVSNFQLGCGCKMAADGSMAQHRTKLAFHGCHVSGKWNQNNRRSSFLKEKICPRIRDLEMEMERRWR
jgi:hypothetical protein